MVNLFEEKEESIQMIDDAYLTEGGIKITIVVCAVAILCWGGSCGSQGGE